MVRITQHGFKFHSKASERYVDVTFEYDDGTRWQGWIPIVYRRTGTELVEPADIEAHLLKASAHCHQGTWRQWQEEQKTFWGGKPKAETTRPIFEALLNFEWRHVACGLPQNPNWARRIQEIKEYGYTLATDINRFCPKCSQRGTHLLLVPLPRGGVSGYETWSPQLRRHIIKLLNGYDAYEGRPGLTEGLLPDHKFPEIRWDEQTRRESLHHLTDQEIQTDFQLVNNQRNQQKHEVCRRCYQTDQRGYPFGIKFFHQGDGGWPMGIPKVGKLAERGCLGCGWYDLEAWRRALVRRLGLPGKT